MTRNKILVADDDRIILSALQRGLLEAGYDVLVATDGEQAVQLGCMQKPDLAVLDIRMPGIFGIEAARRLKARAGIPSIFLTAYADREVVELATKEGALGYLVKPVNSTQLIPAIEAALEQSAALRRLHENEATLTDAIKSNRDISLAIGIYMERFKVTEQQAVAAIRNYARSTRQKLVEVARVLAREKPAGNGLLRRVRSHSRLEPRHKMRPATDQSPESFCPGARPTNGGADRSNEDKPDNA